MATIESTVPTGPPPPAYREAETPQAGATQGAVEIPTFNGKIQASHTYRVVHVPGSRVEDRRIVLRDDASDAQEFVVTFGTQAPSKELRTLILHHHDVDGHVEATAAIPPTDEILGIISYGGNKTKIIEHRSKASIRASQAAATKGDGDSSKYYFEVGDLEWHLSKKYQHPGKGKSRVGDLDLVDHDGNVIAVFLNHWSGSPRAEDLGRLYLTSVFSDIQSGAHGPLPIAILSALIIVLHVNFRDRDGARGFLKDLLTGVAMCSVM